MLRICRDCLMVLILCMYLVVFHWWIWDHVLVYYQASWLYQHPGSAKTIFSTCVSITIWKNISTIKHDVCFLSDYIILEKRHRSHWDGWRSCCLILHITIPDPCLCCHFRSQATSSVKMTGRVKQRLLNGQIFCFHVWNVYPTVCKRYTSAIEFMFVFLLSKTRLVNPSMDPRVPESSPRTCMDTRYPHRVLSGKHWDVSVSTTKLCGPKKVLRSQPYFRFQSQNTKSFFQPNVFRIRINFWLIIWYVVNVWFQTSLIPDDRNREVFLQNQFDQNRRTINRIHQPLKPLTVFFGVALFHWRSILIISSRKTREGLCIIFIFTFHHIRSCIAEQE